jgi:hypothetical protein
VLFGQPEICFDLFRISFTSVESSGRFVSYFLCFRAEQWPASVVDFLFYLLLRAFVSRECSGCHSVLFSCCFYSPCFHRSVLGFSLRSAGRVSFSLFFQHAALLVSISFSLLVLSASISLSQFSRHHRTRQLFLVFILPFRDLDGRLAV